MGCGGSKADDGIKADDVNPTVGKGQKSAHNLTADQVDEVANSRMSVTYQAKEMNGESTRGSKLNARRSSAPFDKAHIGTKTKHGIAPGPRGIVNAKINQDRGVVCWPFHGSLNEALLCVFDGHGPKGERASEFCMTKLPRMLEEDHDALVADPAACLAKQIPALDRALLTDPEIGRMAMNCGTTSNVLYLKGDQMLVASSGDSRAIKATRVGGKIVATDLSFDHKPDLPEERLRIEAAGGTVSPGGPGGRPARVWANGRVGLAMSRSIGDGECKNFGVIPDPEIHQFTLAPAPDEKSDGDVFVIVASDGVWEFIPSQEAADIVASSGNATEACEVLVKEAARRWRIEEGTYRDDITAIITYLPFLEDWGGNDEGADPEEETQVFVNRGAAGIAKLKSAEKMGATPLLSADAAASGAAAATTTYSKGKHENDADDIVARRLSVANMFDGDDEWEKAGEEDEDDD